MCGAGNTPQNDAQVKQVTSFLKRNNEKRVLEEAGKTRTNEIPGAIAQLGERLICIQEVVGSIPSGSTIRLAALAHGRP